MPQEYSHSYQVGLTPVASMKGKNFTRDDIRAGLSVEEYLRDKIREYSDCSKNSVYNQKEVDLSTIVIGERTISFTLYSMEELPILGRSLRLFSQMVLEEPYFQELLVKKKLFKTFVPAEKKRDERVNEILDVSRITDTELAQSVLGILALPECSIRKEVRRALEQMKVLAVESGLLIPKNEEGHAAVLKE